MVVAVSIDQAIETALNIKDPGCTICFVIAPDARPETPAHTNSWRQRLADLLAAIRGVVGNRFPPWGVITAPDQSTFDTMLVRAGSATSLATEYARKDFTIVPRTGPPWQGLEKNDKNALVEYQSHSLVVEPSSRWNGSRLKHLVEKTRDWLVVEGHGRSYCVNEGLICCGRSALENPESTERSCLGILNCATSQHLRIDPRMYNSRIVVLDCCEASNTFSPAVDLGHEPVAFRFLTGKSSCVIATDAMVNRSDRTIIDIAAIAGACRSVGQVAAALSKLRQARNVPWCYWLIGDPETPTFFCSPDFLSHASVSLTSSKNLSLISNEKKHILFATLPKHLGSLSTGVTVFPEGNVARLISINDECVTRVWAILRVPHNNVCITLPEDVVPFLASFKFQQPCLAEAWTRLMTAAKLSKNVPEVEQVLTNCHAASEMLQTIAEKENQRSWPHELWSMGESRIAKTKAKCLICGSHEAFDRKYGSTFNRRVATECARCRISSDFPAERAIKHILFDVPEFPKNTSFTMTLSLQSREKYLVGALSIFFANSDKSILVDPTAVPIFISPNDSNSYVVHVHQTEPPPLAQVYYVRAMLILNLDVYWLSRPIVIPRRDIIAPYSQ